MQIRSVYLVTYTLGCVRSVDLQSVLCSFVIEPPDCSHSRHSLAVLWRRPRKLIPFRESLPADMPRQCSITASVTAATAAPIGISRRRRITRQVLMYGTCRCWARRLPVEEGHAASTAYLGQLNHKRSV